MQSIALSSEVPPRMDCHSFHYALHHRMGVNHHTQDHETSEACPLAVTCSLSRKEVVPPKSPEAHGEVPV